MSEHNRRVLLLAGTGAGAALAIALGIGWAVAGDRSGTVAPPTGSDLPAAAGPAPTGVGLAPSTPPPGVPGADPAGGQAEQPEPESGTGGGGTPDNQPPVIEDPGLSSEGLTLTVAPAVTDPDGDQVSVSIEADGEQLPAGNGPAQRTYPYQDFGAEPAATVTIVATDARGAVTTASFTHQLRVLTTVTVRDLRFALARPDLCFGDAVGRRFEYTLVLAGPVRHSATRRSVLRGSGQRTLLADTSVEVPGDPRQSVILRSDFAGQVDSHSAAYRDSADAFQGMFASTDGCQGTLSYSVDFARR